MVENATIETNVGKSNITAQTVKRTLTNSYIVNKAPSQRKGRIKKYLLPRTLRCFAHFQQ